MIKTFGDLLESLVESEKKKLADFSMVKHPGIIGDMYEGLARHVAAQALRPTVDLRVVKGKIINSKGDLSRQIDCMIVKGEGRQLPYTEHWIYKIEDVIAVIEVKKSLYGADLADAVDLMADLWRTIYEPHEMRGNLLRDAWTSTTGSQLPDDPTSLSLQHEHLFHTLMLEANLPLRIILGFDGFVSERGLRNSLVDLLNSRIEASGGRGARMSPVSMPNLVLCRSASLIKLNGMPYSGPFWADTGRWGFMASRSTKPMHVLLELLWTRLNYYFDAPASIFGDDLDLECVSLLFDARIGREAERLGWAIGIVAATDSELAAAVDKPWQPATLTRAAFEIVNSLCSDVNVLVSNADLLAFIQAEGTTIDAVVKELNDARLAVCVDGRLELLTDECGCVIDPELGFIAAENKTGRLTRWVTKRIGEMAKKKRQPEPGSH